MEEIRNVTWGLWGEELPEWIAIQRLVRAGFHDPRVLLNMFAIIEGESGSYIRAWHANVKRTPAPESNIIYNEEGEMEIKSIDLGFIQRSVALSPHAFVAPTEEDMEIFVNKMFDENPLLARADTAAEEAYELYLERGFQPWYAFKPGTPEFRLKKRRGSKAIGNYLLRTQVGKDSNGKLPYLNFE